MQRNTRPHLLIQTLYNDIYTAEKLASWSVKPNPVAYLLRKQQTREYLEFAVVLEALPASRRLLLTKRFWPALKAVAVVGAKLYAEHPEQKPGLVSVELKNYQVEEYYELMRAYRALGDPRKPEKSSKTQLMVKTPMWRLLQKGCEFGFERMKAREKFVR